MTMIPVEATANSTSINYSQGVLEEVKNSYSGNDSKSKTHHQDPLTISEINGLITEGHI